MTTLRVCTFRGIQNLALYVSQRIGFFATRDLEIELSYTTGSLAQLAGLARGDYDVIQTAPDNVINFDSNPLAFGCDASTAPRIVLLMGGNIGPLGLFAQPTISTIGQLRGAVLGVDNPTSGFALVMYDMLARAQLIRDQDYSVTIAGGTSARLEALANQAVVATILYAPYDGIAESRGFRQLTSSTDHYAAYASLATAGNAEWVEAHSDTLTRYIAAIVQALHWIHEPANSAAAVEILQREPALALDTATAARAYAAFVDPVTGFGTDARLSDAALQHVIDLRSAYADPPGPLGPSAAYQDLRWYHKALSEIC